MTARPQHPDPRSLPADPRAPSAGSGPSPAPAGPPAASPAAASPAAAVPDESTPVREEIVTRLPSAEAPHEVEVGREPIVSARGITKRYGDLTAVDAVDFDVEPGEFLGFLGPNGAGKTTLMKMIYCLVEPTAGTLHVFGREVREGAREIKGRLGVVAQEDNLDPDLTVWDNLMVYARYFGLDRAKLRPRAEELLEFMELTAKRDRVIMHLSGGMKRRLAIARSLLNQPEVVILDEPTTGLDPQVRHVIWDRLLALKEQGITFLLTTHYMEEAENLCDRLHIMDEGRIISSGRPLELVRRHVGDYALEVLAGTQKEAEIAEAWPDLERQRSGQRLYLYAEDRETLMPVLDALEEAEARLRPASVEDVFLKLTGREIRE